MLLLVNLVLWASCFVCCLMFTLRSSIVLLVVAMMVLMLVMPYAEAAEQTVLQRVVPFERQGRVFGFAQSVENAASPLTAFLIGPVAQLLVIPFMTDGAGAQTDRRLVRHRPRRGIALVFVVTGSDRPARHRGRDVEPPLPPARCGVHPALGRRGASQRRSSLEPPCRASEASDVEV